MTTDLIMILDAASFAADRHRMQRRKDAEASPYINHPLALADILAREGGVEDAKVGHANHEQLNNSISHHVTPKEMRPPLRLISSSIVALKLGQPRS